MILLEPFHLLFFFLPSIVTLYLFIFILFPFFSFFFFLFCFVLFCFICFMLPILAITVPRTMWLNRDSNGSLLFWHRPILKLKRIMIVSGSRFSRSDRTVRSEFQNLANYLILCFFIFSLTLFPAFFFLSFFLFFSCLFSVKFALLFFLLQSLVANLVV